MEEEELLKERFQAITQFEDQHNSLAQVPSRWASSELTAPQHRMQQMLESHLVLRQAPAMLPFGLSDSLKKLCV
ncbi:hypothetical protein E2320_010491 [Naja naja]|nr:hypothetical protein E2320_010491 [Naja naja]